MSQTTATATPETTSHAAATQPAALIPPAIDAAMIAPPPAEAARPQVPPPEKQEAPEVSQPMPAAANDASIAPPTEGKPLPKPPIHTVAAPMGEVANDAHLIENNIAKFVADRLPPEMRAGLTVDFEETPSNKITSEGQLDKGLRDVCIKFTGGKLENPAVAQELSEQLRAAMREHPAFEGMSFGGVEQEIEHMMRCQILALEPERFNKLMEPQPRVTKTFISSAALLEQASQAVHTCAGAGCSQCSAPAHAEKPTHPKPHGEHQHSHPHHDKPHESHVHAAATHTPTPHAVTPNTEPQAAAHAAMPAASVAAQVTPAVPPVTQVVAPAQHQGIAAAANDQQMRIGA